MDFHVMKRKKLQKLCKKHHLPANLTNLEMAHKLSSLFKDEEKGKLMKQTRPCLKNYCSGNEEKNDGLKKKVRFSPENEVFQLGDRKIELYELKRVETRRPAGAKGSLDQMVLISSKAYS